MSIVDQLSVVMSSVAALEQSLAEQSGKMDTLAAENAALAARNAAFAAENAALRQKLAETSPPPVPDSAGEPHAVEWGFVANETDAPAAFAPAVARVKSDGGQWLRLWHTGFGPVSAATAKMVTAARQAGLGVVLCVQPKDAKPADLGTPDFAGFVKTNAATLRQLAYLEAGNELNLAQYRPDDLGGQLDWHKPYVDRWLRPLSAALQTVGVKTLCASVTDTYHPQNYPTQYDALLAAGAADCCDGLALHAYFLPQYLQNLSVIVADLKAKWAKPIYVTECNVLTQGLTPTLWQQRLPAYIATLRRSGVSGLMFYRGFVKTSGKWNWPVLFDNAGTPTEAYAVFRTALTAPLPAV